ncbi:MAG: hypothetical protein OXC92_01660 [Flavobacteriaceae bacterium]|nr:hypothetical protein [Flavobacteriaceae bacterium]
MKSNSNGTIQPNDAACKGRRIETTDTPSPTVFGVCDRFKSSSMPNGNTK